MQYSKTFNILTIKIMKIFKFMTLALVAMLGFSSCSEDCNHEFIEVDYSKDLVGTWTCLEAENDYAEALTFNADGTVTSTGAFDGDFWEKKGTFKIKGNKITLSFEDGDYIESRFEMVAGEVFSMVWDDELDIRYTYHYCENDLSDEIVGTWVWQDGENSTIQTFTEDGKLFTTSSANELHGNLKQQMSEYKVVGDLRFHIFIDETIEHRRYLPARLVYTPKGTNLGDIMSITFNAATGDDFVETTKSFVRVKENLNLAGQKYAYSSAYITNAKGTNEDFSILGNTFNMSNIEGSDFDVVFGVDLYCVELNVNSITHKFRPNGQDVEVVTPITVDGNKVILDMSPINSACRTVEMYMFQDADDSQLHIYMPTKAFINYFVNLEVPALIEAGKLDPTDDTAVEKLFADMEARIQSINVSFVFKTRK